MTLLELSRQYDIQADALQLRIFELQLLWSRTQNDRLRSALADRIRVLTAMRREARELSALCEHYYERGYRRNERYSI